MTISAKVLAHSSHQGCPDLITLQVRYPRFIHAEFMTHRVFSRNASSSRAIPIKRMIEDVVNDPAMPVAWGSNKPGMQAGDDIEDIGKAMEIWLQARDAAVEFATDAMNLGLHKQVVNRILEPFGHISVVVTATEWDNFFALRCHPAADPTMLALANAMRDAIAQSMATPLHLGEWHLPYADEMRKDGDARMASAARCARVSYLTHFGDKPTLSSDMKLAEMLKMEKHLSPFEHQARPTPGEKNGPLNGWKSLRSVICA